MPFFIHWIHWNMRVVLAGSDGIKYFYGNPVRVPAARFRSLKSYIEVLYNSNRINAKGLDCAENRHEPVVLTGRWRKRSSCTHRSLPIRASSGSCVTSKGAWEKPGDIMTAEFEMAGQEFCIVNGGPHFKHSPAMSPPGQLRRSIRSGPALGAVDGRRR